MKTTKNKTTKIRENDDDEEEECGIWLDTTELRRRKEQTRRKQPIYKLLNPLARSVGYSTAVTLNFTQTKMQMPATRQSTISSFYTPKIKTSEGKGESSTVHPLVMSSTPLPEPHMGSKRKREMSYDWPSELDKLTSHVSQEHSQDSDASFQRDSDDVCKDQKKEQHFVHLIWGYQSEESEPAEKRRPNVLENVTETQQDGDKAEVHRCTSTDVVQDFPETLMERDQRDSPEMEASIFKETSSGSSLPVKGSESLRPRVLTMRSDTENQRTPKRHSKLYKELRLCSNAKWSPVKRQDKENHRPTSPAHCGEFVHPKRLLTASPAKISSDVQVRSSRSPRKPVKETVENERDSFAMLFTQDSEGFRVIANRNPDTRCPLMDRTNSTEDRDNWNIPSPRLIETEESSDLEPDMLFTQDSQGNMVIKH